MLIGGVVAVVLILNAGSSTSTPGKPGPDGKVIAPSAPPGKAPNRFIGIWHSDKAVIINFKTIEFTADGKFHHDINLKSPERAERHTTTYSLLGGTANVFFTRRITVNGEVIENLTARMLSDDEIEIEWLRTKEKRMRVK